MSAEKPGKLRLQLIDVFGDPLQERVDIQLRHQTLSDAVAARAVDASKRIVITDLYANPQGLYRLYIDPPSYLPVSTFVNIDGDGFTDKVLTFAVDPQKVVRVDFPLWKDFPAVHDILESSKLVPAGNKELSGQDLYEAIDDIRRAGLLNIVAKSGRTRFDGGSTVLDYLQQITELRGDRFFAVVAKELRQHVKNAVPSGQFFEVPDSLHRPEPGFTMVDSFKTDDHYGNLQLTFSVSSDYWVADIDIDDANGLEHIFQVARNALTGRPTHPYDIQQILVKYQEIDPGYRLILREEPAPQAKSAGQKG